MKTFQSTFSERQLISSADTDFTGKLSLSGLVNAHIQIAWHHAEHLEFGKEFLHENELAWVLSRMHIYIEQYPEWNEELLMTSWPKGINRLFYLRDFQFTNLAQRPVSRATSEWLMINWKNKRPKLFEDKNNVFKENLDKHAVSETVPVLTNPDAEAEIFENQVVYSDIDLNQHLTTTRYIEWMLDCFDISFLKEHRCHELVINFIKEIPFGSEVEIKRYPGEKQNCYLYEYYLKKEGTLCFRGYVEF